jgi:helix-turn-helix, Psq domain
MSDKKLNWTQEALQEALNAVNNGMPKRKAAKAYGIPWGTFINKITGRRGYNSAPEITYLTSQEEQEIVTFIKDSADRGFGKTKQELMINVQQMLNFRNRETKWLENKPTEKWYRNFKQRYPQIVLRTPQKLGKQRASVTQESILKWFEDFTNTIKGIDASILLEPNRILNCDESGFWDWEGFIFHGNKICLSGWK